MLETGACLATIAAADQAMDQHMAHAGNYVHDSIITIRVKTKLAAKHLSTRAKIQVDTDSRGTIRLSGNASTQDASDLAEMIAKSTDNVTAVHYKIVVHG
jgi:osmotically-inducible protein OsmY